MAKTERIGVRLTEEERTRLELVALLRGVTISEVIREAALAEIERAEAGWDAPAGR